jgi:drug/metabolite transporter (DMT)-like permease
LLAYCASFSFAYVQLGAAAGAMLLFTAVQATVLLLGARAGKALRAPDLAGIALALGGVAILLAPDARAGPMLAMISMVAAGVAWGVYSVLGQQAGDPAQRTAGNFILAALLAAPLAGLDAGLLISARGAVFAAVSGAVTSALGYVLWYRLVPRLPQAAIGAVQLATPVLAAVGAALLLAEPLSLRLGVAALLILGGISLTLGRR